MAGKKGGATQTGRKSTGSKQSRRRTARGAKPAASGGNLWLLARHDFRQPAQSLELLAQGLERAVSATERRQYAIAIAHVAASLGEMINCMSLVARLDAGEARPSPEPLELAAEVAQSLIGLEPGVERSRRIVCGAMAGRVLADRTLAAAALRGFLIYSIRLCDASNISLAAETRGSRVALVATLQGSHADGALASLAFVELPPREGAGAKPLVGLGPALALRVVRHMGGDLVLDATRNGIARVTLLLPAAPLA